MYNGVPCAPLLEAALKLVRENSTTTYVCSHESVCHAPNQQKIAVAQNIVDYLRILGQQRIFLHWIWCTCWICIGI